MKLSVVLSTYNGENFIIEQLESIRNQSRKADEVLIFDDCSTDGTVKLINQFVENYKLTNWSVSINKENKGWKKNFIEGIWKASGELVFPCDQDDVWLQNKLEIMEKIMVENPQIQLLTSNYQAFYDSGKESNGPEIEDEKLVKQTMKQNLFDTKYPGCTYCIRRHCVKISEKYWEEDFPHDAFFWRIAIVSDSLYSYHKSLMRWRKHSDSTYAVEIMQNKTKEKKRKWFDYALKVVNTMEDCANDLKVDNFVQKKKTFDLTRAWLKLRIKFYDTKNIFCWLSLLKYRKCYERFRQYIGDFYLVFIKHE